MRFVIMITKLISHGGSLKLEPTVEHVVVCNWGKIWKKKKNNKNVRHFATNQRWDNDRSWSRRGWWRNRFSTFPVCHGILSAVKLSNFSQIKIRFCPSVTSLPKNHRWGMERCWTFETLVKKRTVFSTFSKVSIWISCSSIHVAWMRLWERIGKRIFHSTTNIYNF